MTTQSAIRDVIGVRGLNIFSGLIREEYLTELRSWRSASRIYIEMADDAIVGTLLDAIRTPLLAADFDVPPLSDAEGDQRAAEFLKDAMDRMEKQTWRSHVNDSMDFLQFGFSFSEITLEKRDDGRLWIKNLDPRGQETLHRWEWEDDQMVAMTQRDPATGQHHTIPNSKAVHVTFRSRKGDPQGKPLLRSLFRPWLKLKYLENFEAIGIERDVGGMAVVDFPDPEKWAGSADMDHLKETFEDAFKNLRMDENMWLLVPPGARASSWGSGQRSYNVREAIVAKQKEILLRFFAQFLMLDHAGLDASGLLKGSQDFFQLGLKSIQQELLEAWNQQLVPLLFQYNSFPGMTRLPKITWNDPGKVDVAALVTAYVQASQARLITPVKADEEHVRDLMDLPDLPEGEGDGPRNPAPEPGPFGPFKLSMSGDHGLMLHADPESAGRALRLNPDRWDSFLNNYQTELVGEYDTWLTETRSQLAQAVTDRLSSSHLTRILEARLQDLEVNLKGLGRRRIFEAGMAGLGKTFAHRRESAGVQTAIAQMQRRNDAFLAESLIPDVRRALAGSLDSPDVSTLRAALNAAGEPLRARVAGYSGGATVAVFETQKRAGIDENAERRARGEDPIAVRWVLDRNADHCADDPARGTFGCLTLARTYAEGFDSLPTVPAGNVSCLGGCKCHLEMNDGSGWKRA